jgi:hypothetical protein
MIFSNLTGKSPAVTHPQQVTVTLSPLAGVQTAKAADGANAAAPKRLITANREAAKRSRAQFRATSGHDEVSLVDSPRPNPIPRTHFAPRPRRAEDAP